MTSHSGQSALPFYASWGRSCRDRAVPPLLLLGWCGTASINSRIRLDVWQFPMVPRRPMPATSVEGERDRSGGSPALVGLTPYQRIGDQRSTVRKDQQARVANRRDRPVADRPQGPLPACRSLHLFFRALARLRRWGQRSSPSLRASQEKRRFSPHGNGVSLAGRRGFFAGFDGRSFVQRAFRLAALPFQARRKGCEEHQRPHQGGRAWVLWFWPRSGLS